MINILICDDEINDANIVKACIENLLDSKNIAYNIEICLNAKELIEKSKNVNFLFLDMEINGISGIDMGSKLRTLKKSMSHYYYIELSKIFIGWIFHKARSVYTKALYAGSI